MRHLEFFKTRKGKQYLEQRNLVSVHTETNQVIFDEKKVLANGFGSKWVGERPSVIKEIKAKNVPDRSADDLTILASYRKNLRGYVVSIFSQMLSYDWTPQPENSDSFYDNFMAELYSIAFTIGGIQRGLAVLDSLVQAVGKQVASTAPEPLTLDLLVDLMTRKSTSERPVYTPRPDYVIIGPSSADSGSLNTGGVHSSGVDENTQAEPDLVALAG